MPLFISHQSKAEVSAYKSLLKTAGSFSKLYSDSTIPYLYYRIAENAFCRAFCAENLSRSDCSADAKKQNIGLGLKTFQEKNGRTFQKIAEFNKSRDVYSKFESNSPQMIKTISEMRNKRISSTKHIHGIEHIIYHCVTRTDGEFYIYEQEMDPINLDCLRIEKEASNTIYFSDGLNEYNFNKAKNTLFKRFITKNPINIEIDIFEDPFDILENCYSEYKKFTTEEGLSKLPMVTLPLFSLQGGKHVPERSGLNQWNAGGRLRSAKEVYIPIPSWIHSNFSDFFPNRDTPFSLQLPNGKFLNAKVCQAGRKALMSNPNTDLGDWLINEVLDIEEGKIVTLKTLEEVGIDSVEIKKQSGDNYSIDFKDIGSYEEFYEENRSH